MTIKKMLFAIISIIVIIICGIIIYNIPNKAIDNSSKAKENTTANKLNIDMEKAKEVLTNRADKEAGIRVNDENITQLDLNYQKLINDNFNIKQSNNNLVEQCIKNKVILQEAKKNNISISEEEKNVVKEYYSNMYNEEDEKIAIELEMTKSEYSQKAIEKIIENRNIVEFHNYIFMKILKDEIKIDNQDFNGKIAKAKEETNMNQKTSLYEGAYETYIYYLVENSSIVQNN